MIGQWLKQLFYSAPAQVSSTPRQRLFFDGRPDFIYAIGDVHGRIDLLTALEEKIAADARALEGTSYLVMLGDYVDRGPNSASVLDRLIVKRKGAMERFSLAGNHEEVMLDFLKNPASDHRWLEFGGLETLYSYGIYEIPANKQRLQMLLQSHIPDDHIAFLEALPTLMSVPGHCFVHAGIEPGVELKDQTEETLLWSRPKAAPSGLPQDFTVVHGHTPVKTVVNEHKRINIDTGAYKSGILSAVRIARNGEILVLQTD